jgi:N-acetylmuramic acid 6-phosphate etherase
MLKTEQPHPQHSALDSYPLPQLIDAFVQDQTQALAAVQAAAAHIEQAVAAAVPRLAQGGRLIYVGAGTSGRLGVLDSVELHPTFSWPHERSLALLAGGKSAMFEAVEGAEDDQDQGAADMAGAKPGAHDVVIGLAASGGTPYVLGALAAARTAGALTIGMANNPNAPVLQQAEISILLDTGSEVISGSTRLKAGTAQKIALNTFSSAVMVRLHKVYGNLMVDLRATNRKLRQRAIDLTVRTTGADETAARATLAACAYQVKVAIVALKNGVTVETAAAQLEQVQGNVRQATQ